MKYRYFKIVNNKYEIDEEEGVKKFIDDLFLMSLQIEEFKVIKAALWHLLPKILIKLENTKIECWEPEVGLKLFLAGNDDLELLMIFQNESNYLQLLDKKVSDMVYAEI